MWFCFAFISFAWCLLGGGFLTQCFVVVLYCDTQQSCHRAISHLQLSSLTAHKQFHMGFTVARFDRKVMVHDAFAKHLPYGLLPKHETSGLESPHCFPPPPAPPMSNLFDVMMGKEAPTPPPYLCPSAGKFLVSHTVCPASYAPTEVCMGFAAWGSRRDMLGV